MDLFTNIEEKTKDNYIENISREQMTSAFIHTLKNKSLLDLVSIITSEFNEVLEYADLLNGGNTCQKTSLLFNPHRLNVKSKNSKFSVYDAMSNDGFCSGLARAILYKRSPKGIKYKDMLYQTLSMNIDGVQYINEFPPNKARKLYEKFGINKDSKILDPCAGWGGRMIGASVICNNYECFEPSTETARGLIQLFNFIKSINKDFNAVVNCIPFEESELMQDSYDFAFTSPPYYDTEQYCNEETNSYIKFKTFEEWTNGFYLPMIDKTMKALKNNSTFVINIGSREYPLNKILIDTFANKYTIEVGDEQLQGKSGLKVKEKEGEKFYYITKS
jgi:hypothetical protein